MKRIEVQNLSKVYQVDALKDSDISFRELLFSQAASFFKKTSKKETFKALDDISFDVQEGEVLGIIGKNGSGKSTLLKILSKIVTPTSGRAIIRGRVASMLEVGTGFHAELTGRENIYLSGVILGMKRWEISKHFDEIVFFAGIEKFLDAPVKKYSTGMKLRLAYSIAAHLQPEILLIDEVLAVGDYEFEKKCLDSMGALSKVGRTILFVSHNLVVVKRLCCKVLVLNKGKQTFFGHPGEAFNYYFGSAEKQQNVRTWGLQGLLLTEFFHLLSVKVIDIEGQERERLYLEEKILIEVSYRFFARNKNICLIFHFYDSGGDLLFATYQKLNGEGWQEGLKKIVCIVPENVLEAGRVSVGMEIFDFGEKNKLVDFEQAKLFSEKAFLSFLLEERKEDTHESIDGNFWQIKNGKIRPMVEWRRE